MSLSDKRFKSFCCKCGEDKLYRYEEEDVKEFIKKCENGILDLSILEINKDLTISELVEKAIDKIRKEAGPKLLKNKKCKANQK